MTKQKQSYYDEKTIELLACACHSAWYAYTVLGLGEDGQPWERCPQWQSESLMFAIDFWEEKINELTKQAGKELDNEELANRLSPLSHDNWMTYKMSHGWVYGETKDPKRKTHPCIVPYEELPESQRLKDRVVVVAFLSMRSVLLENKG